ncbi:MAG: hypothetical protein Q9228_003152 [Teloschistes exilis]
MVNFHSITLLTLIASVLSKPTLRSLNVRQLADPHAQVIFRSDLKSVALGQSPEFKNLLRKSVTLDLISHLILSVSSTPSSNASAGYEITFVNIAESANANRAVLESKGMPLGVSQNTTLYFNAGSNPSDPKGPQPITLGKTQSGLGFLYMTGAELKLGSASPEWDSWIICDGAEYGVSHPVLRWVGVVPTLINGAMQGLVTILLTLCSGKASMESDSSSRNSPKTGMDDKTNKVSIAMQRDYPLSLAGTPRKFICYGNRTTPLQRGLALHRGCGKVAAGEKVDDDDEVSEVGRAVVEQICSRSIHPQVKHEGDVSNQENETPMVSSRVISQKLNKSDEAVDE